MKFSLSNHPAHAARLHAIATATLLGLSLAAGSAQARTPSEPIVIDSLVTPSTFSGEFAVSNGASALGCSGGTFTDSLNSQGGVHGSLTRVLTCTSGEAGDIVVRFLPFTSAPLPYGGDGGGHWTVLRATGAFAGLHGNGDYAWTIVDENTSTDSMVGFFFYTP